MNMSKTLTTVGVGAAIVAGSMMAVTAASAHYGGDNSERVAEFAERFELEESEVQAYFDEKHEARQQERETARAEHMAGLVEAGTLPQEQADALSAKHEELRAAVQSLKESDASREEMKSQMEENRDAMQAWAEEQGINLDDVRPEKGEGHRKGPRGGFGN